MKKFIALIFLFTPLISFGQKNENGKIFNKHPGIDLIASFHQAYVTGDIEKASLILHEDVRFFDGNTENKEAKGRPKNIILNNIKWLNNDFDYLSMNNTEGAFPDALEYKKGGNWVQSWFHVYGVNKNTGVELDHPVLRIYRLNEDSSKIIAIIEYSNKRNFGLVSTSTTDRKNGIIYNSHENINTVRKSIYSFLNKDYDKAWSFWHQNARFQNLYLPWGTSLSLEEAKKSNSALLENFELYAIDEIGYPDYIEYDESDSKNVLSWWIYRFKKKSDGKLINVPIHHSIDFDDEGKIIAATSYWNQSLFD